MVSLREYSHLEKHVHLYQSFVHKKGMAIGLTTNVVDIYMEPKCLHTMGPFYETHPHPSPQSFLSPVLWSSFSFHVCDILTKLFVAVH